MSSTTTNNNQKREREDNEDINNKESKLKKTEIEIEADKDFKPPPLISKNEDNENIAFKSNIKPPSKPSAKPSFGGISFNITTKVLPQPTINNIGNNNEKHDDYEKESINNDDNNNNNNNNFNTDNNNSNSSKKTTAGPIKPTTINTVGPQKPTTINTVGPTKPTKMEDEDSSSSESGEDDGSENKNKKQESSRPTVNNIGPQKPTTNVGPQKPTTNVGPQKPTTNVGPQKPTTNVGPQKPTTNTIGPQRPTIKDDDSSSSDSDSDDDSNKNKIKNQQQGIVGPIRPIMKKDEDEDEDDSDDSDDSDDDEKEEIERWRQLATSLPISHEVTIKGHARTVSTISIDPSGSRMLSGSYDCKVKFWDFNGMDSSFRSFREIEPSEGTQVRSIQFSTLGDIFSALPYTTQIRIYNRDGHFKNESVSGDRFIQDLYHTKGHVSTLTGQCWHPTERDELISSSIDGTIRVWDVNQLNKNKSVIKSKNQKGSRVGVINCCFDQRGDLITGGMSDGTIAQWDKRSTLLKPKFTFQDAHEFGTEVTSIQYNRDCYSMISRGMDSTLRVWDLRNPLKPLIVWDDLLCDYIETNTIFGSYDRVIVTGTSSAKGGFGSIVIYDLSSLTKMRQIRVEDDVSVVNCHWSTKLNQIFFGCSDSSIRGFYDPTQSTNGLKLCASKAPRVKNVADFEPDRPIITPNTLPLFRQTNHKKEKKSQKINPSKEQLKSTTYTSNSTMKHLVSKIGIINNTSWKEDARESFLRMANKKDKTQQQTEEKK
ncbi:hypothetical protein ACTFIU_000816 [Dictyostelium citrinum]